MKREKKTFSEKSNRDEELTQELISLKRVTKVTKGGRRFNFSALMLVKDNRKNSIEFANSKGNEVVTAIRKAVRKAKKNMLVFFPPETRTVPYDVFVKFKSTKIMIKPAPFGNGIRAGGPLRSIFKLIGIKDVTAKIIGSNNKLNVVKCSFLALSKFLGKGKNI